MGKVMRHTLGASLNIRHNLSSSKGPKPLQLKLRSEERFSRNAETELVCRLLLEKKKSTSARGVDNWPSGSTTALMITSSFVAGVASIPARSPRPPPTH